MTIKEILERAEAGDKVSLEAAATFIGDRKDGEGQHGPWTLLRVGLTGDDGGQIYMGIFNKGDLQPPRVEKGDRLSIADAKVDARDGKLQLKATADQVTIAGAAPPAERASTAAGGQRSQGGGGRPEAPGAEELSDLWLWHFSRAVAAKVPPEQASGGATSLLIARSENRCTTHYAPEGQWAESGGGDEPEDYPEDDPSYLLAPDDTDIPFASPFWLLPLLAPLAGWLGALAGGWVA
jgi:hypothetical protein